MTTLAVQGIQQLWSRRKRRLLLAAVVLLLTATAALLVGGAQIPATHIAAMALQPIAPGLAQRLAPDGIGAVQQQIVFGIRLPRILLAAFVGAALALAGTTFQGMFRNPMADPYLLGVSSGAALGAALTIFFNVRFTFGPWNALPLAAFAGALLTTLAVYQLARRTSRGGGVLPVATLLLAGLAMAALVGALVSLLVYLAGERMPPILFWLMGSLDGANWSQVLTVLLYILPTAGVITFSARELNVLLLGEEAAYHRGVNVDTTYRLLLIAATLLTAAAVSVSGVIGFVGLIVPHATRLLVGNDHRLLLPAAALTGAFMLLGADTIARTVLAPAELPVGIVTALVGGPFFLHLLQRHA